MWSITQTSDGFLWFASVSQGMYRFDGVRFLPWASSANGRPISQEFRSVYGDRAGGLWALGTREIVHLKAGVVTSYSEVEGHQYFNSMQEGPDGSFWAVRGSNAAAGAPLCRFSENSLKCFGKSDGLPTPQADALLVDTDGKFWVGGLQTELLHWSNGVSQVYPIEALKANLVGVGVTALARGPDGTLWVGSLAEEPGLGLGRLIGGAVKALVTPGLDGSKLSVQTMAFDHQGSLWVGTLDKGLFRIRGNVVEHYGRAEGLSGDGIFAFFEDREGIFWVVTTDGIDSFRDPRVTTFSALEGLGPAAVGVLAGKDGTIWVSNAGSLDHIVNGRVTSIHLGHGLPPGGQVASLLEDSAGNMWVGVESELYLFKNGQFRPRIRRPGNQPLGLVLGMTEDIDGNIWAECAGPWRGLARIRDFQVREELPKPQIPAGHALAADPHGGIWIQITKGDLGFLRNGAYQNWSLNLSGTAISQIVARADGSVLVPAPEGLVEVRQGKVQRMTSKNGLPCDGVISLIEDKENRWWLFTECGVVEFPDSELQRWWVDPETVIQTHVYDVLDGARTQGRPSFNAAAYSPDGRVWFANGAVVQMVDPAMLSQKTLPAETYIESVVVDRKELAGTRNLKLSPHPRELQIDYTSPTFTIPQRVKFRYRLDNYDRDWHDAGTRRQAFYTDLPPGKYSFRVMACNSDGVWNDNAAKLDFSVSPAYYQTNWFRALCAVFFVALLWGAYQWRVQQLHRQFEMKLDARVSERTRIARELHDTLLQGAHGLLLRFSTVSQLLPERAVEAKDKLDSAIEQTAEFITEARDEVQGLRDSTTQTNDLAQAMSTLGEELAADSTGHRPAFRVAVEGQSRDLHPILRDEVYKIAAEALRNAFLHANAKQVEVEIRYDDESFRLRVRDDGKGIDAAVLSAQSREGHYGLPGMRERATLIGGKLTIWSEVDAGAEVELRVPASIAYATARRRSWLSQAFAAKARGEE